MLAHGAPSRNKHYLLAGVMPQDNGGPQRTTAGTYMRQQRVERDAVDFGQPTIESHAEYPHTYLAGRARFTQADWATMRERNDLLEHRVAALTAELQAAHVELELSARLKTEFLATVSHELRTPLTGVLGAADVLEEEVHGALNAKQQNSVRMIRESGKQLLGLINNILDLSRIEAGCMALDLQTVDASAVCSAALAVVHSEAERKNLSANCVSTPTQIKLLADPLRLKQVLLNLLSNAVKFTPAGGSIGIEVMGDDDGRNVHFTVYDTGIGIAAEQQPRLFTPFVQLDSGLDRHYSGAGLGLALVHRLVELHGGSLSLESRPGAGSRFTVTLPWKQAQTVF